MWKANIMGTEDSPVMAFAKILNLPDPQTGKQAAVAHLERA